MLLHHEPIIRVGILINDEIEFQLKGNFRVNGQLIPEGNYNAIEHNKLIQTNFAKLPFLELIPEDKAATFTLRKVKIGIGFHWEQFEDQEFEGGLILQMEEGKIRAVNSVPLESYLKSVISSEMSAMNDLTLLKVHAIVSRSWLLAQIQKKSDCKSTTDWHASSKASAHNEGTVEEIIKWYDREDHESFDVCADDHCQRYQGISKVISENAKQAVDETCGQVITYENEICDARFSKCCGGITEDFENVWQAVSLNYLTAVRDFDEDNLEVNQSYFTSAPKAWCNTSDPKVLQQVLVDFDRKTNDFYRWRVDYTQQQLSELIHKKSGIDFGQIVNLIPLKRGKSGRIIKLKIVGSKKEIIIGKELEIRKWLSESHLYSSAFIVKKHYKNDELIPSLFIFLGAGWGHGVGMCQIGAAVMSKEGYKLDEILSHYFSGTAIEKRYSK
ncbi:MAG: SpoIID/LytB domain-containing protein [Prolixibacteraceae bacterium]